jgi:hypothetical protein
MEEGMAKWWAFCYVVVDGLLHHVQQRININKHANGKMEKYHKYMNIAS